MIQQRLQQWIQHPEELSEDSLRELREMLVRYPYFQTARLLYLKNLYALGDASFKSELQKSALYIADLSVLFYFIEKERLAVRQHAEEHPKDAGEASRTDRTLDLIDRFLSDMPEQLGDELPLPAETNVDYVSVLMREEEEAEDVTPLKGQELIDRFIKGATTEELRARRDWSGVQIELAEYAIRGINDELAKRCESDV